MKLTPEEKGFIRAVAKEPERFQGRILAGFEGLAGGDRRKMWHLMEVCARYTHCYLTQHYRVQKKRRFYPER